jgi:hypothetical protein
MKSVGVVRCVAAILVLVAIVLPATQYASASGPEGHHATVRHAPRTPPSTARSTAVSGVIAIPLVPLAPVASVASSAAVVVSALPLAAPFVPPRS